MATKPAIAAALKGLAANYNRQPDPALTDIWWLALQDVPDDRLSAAVGRIVARSRFFPTVAEVRDALGLNVQPLPDVTGICERLRGMCDYHPNHGTMLPSVERVRRELGEAIADAYGYIGPNRLEAVVFGGGGVGADIAGREFATALSTAQEAGQVVALPPVRETPRLSNASQSVFIDGVPDGGLRRLETGH